MNVTPEELAAFADGELGEPRQGEIAAAVAADPALAAEIARHRALKERLSAHFAPILHEPVPEKLTALLPGGREAQVVDLATARQRRAARRIPRWGWIAGPALAASLALAVFLPRGGSVPDGYAGGKLADALDSQLVASQASDAPTRVLLSFRNGGGQVCRAFTDSAQSGIACRDANGWRLAATGAAATARQGDYQMAGSDAADLMAKVQTMAAGPALSAEQERAARSHGWR